MFKEEVIRRALFPVFGLMILLASVWCSDKGTGSDNEPDIEPEPAVQFDFADYAIVDSNNLYHLIVHTSTNHRSFEPFVDGDYVLGEPFIDVNGNGTYERGLDIFTRSSDPEINHDLNFNGQYDGPGSNYAPGSRYDDVNRNGQYDYPDDLRNDGEPFCDMNLDGIYEPYLDGGGWGYVVTPSIYSGSNDYGWQIKFSMKDSCYQHITDSNSVYVLPQYDRPGSNVREIELVWAQSGFGAFIPISVESYQSIVLDLIAPGLNDTGQVRISPRWRAANYGASVTYLKSSSLGHTLELHDSTYTDLLRIRFDQPETNDSTANVAYEGAFIEFFFVEQYGLLSIRTNNLYEWIGDVVDQIDFIKITDPLPLPMIQ